MIATKLHHAKRQTNEGSAATSGSKSSVMFQTVTWCPRPPGRSVVGQISSSFSFSGEQTIGSAVNQHDGAENGCVTLPTTTAAADAKTEATVGREANYLNGQRVEGSSRSSWQDYSTTVPMLPLTDNEQSKSVAPLMISDNHSRPTTTMATIVDHGDIRHVIHRLFL